MWTVVNRHTVIPANEAQISATLKWLHTHTNDEPITCSARYDLWELWACGPGAPSPPLGTRRDMAQAFVSETVSVCRTTSFLPTEVRQLTLQLSGAVS